MNEKEMFLNEFKRLEGIDFPTEKGLLILDFGALYPYSDQKLIQFRVGLSNESDGSDDVFFKDCVINHRYPNTDYITISKKVGRRISKLCYYVVDDIETINNYRFLIIEYSKPDSFVYQLTVPVCIELTEENPAGILNLQASFQYSFSNFGSKPNITFEEYSKSTDNTLYSRHLLTHHFTEGWGGIFGYLKEDPDQLCFLLKEKEVCIGENSCEIEYGTVVDIQGMPLEYITFPIM